MEAVSSGLICILFLVCFLQMYGGNLCSRTKCPRGELLNCSARDIASIPDSLDKEATILDLSINNITIIPDGAFAEIEALLELYVQSNQIGAIQPDAFRGLQTLKLLDLSQNKLLYIDKVFYPNIFAALKSLSVLHLDGNVVVENSSYPDEAIGECRNLQVLTLDASNSGNFGPGFANLTKLVNLTMRCSSVPNNIIRKLYNISFHNLANLQMLDLSGCRIKYIDSGAFVPLKNLAYLDLSYNICGGLALLRNISYGLQFTPATFLNMSNMVNPHGRSKFISTHDLEFFRNTSLLQIDASSNNIEMLKTGALQNLPSALELLDVSKNRFLLGKYISDIVHLKNVKVIMANNLNSYIPIAKYTNLKNLPVFGSIDDLENNNPCKNSKMRIPLLPQNLKEVSCRSSGFRLHIPYIPHSPNNSLEKLDLRNNLFHTWTGPACFDQLKYLDLSNNYCESVSNIFFIGMPELETLKVGCNLIGNSLEKDVNGSIFKPLNKLKHLDLHANGIYNIPVNCFSGLVSLEKLNLSDNGLESWEADISHMKKLTYLDLSSNYLEMLPKDTREALSEISKTRHLSVNLNDVNIQCICENIEFLEWFVSVNITFVDRVNYTCLNATRQRIRLVNDKDILLDLKKKCSSHSLIIITCSVLLGLFLVLIVCGILYRYRWKLRYLYYMTWGRYSIIKDIKDKNYTYDAFVSYASENDDFVKQKMLPNLEDRFGLSLCVHDRDFTPGKEIAANVVNAIQNSRKIVVLLSPAFLESYWCMFEFNMTRMEKIYLRGSEEIMFAVMLNNLYTYTLPMEILHLIQSQSYIEYPNDPQGDVIFWERIKQAITS